MGCTGGAILIAATRLLGIPGKREGGGQEASQADEATGRTELQGKLQTRGYVKFRVEMERAACVVYSVCASE